MQMHHFFEAKNFLLFPVQEHSTEPAGALEEPPHELHDVDPDKLE